MTISGVRRKFNMDLDRHCFTHLLKREWVTVIALVGLGMGLILYASLS